MNMEYIAASCYNFCYEEIQERFGKQPENELHNIFSTYCLPRCPEKCDITRYNIQKSYLTFPTRVYFKNNNYSQLNFTDNYNVLEKSILRLETFYSLSTKITTYNVKCSLADLISKIGGLLGCFLGASLISMVEIFELILEIFLKLLNRKNKVNVKKPVKK